ncbi:hypothetical protein FKM82_014670 [Ascaphus truei]
MQEYNLLVCPTKSVSPCAPIAQLIALPSCFIQACPPAHYIERFNVALGQYMGALHSIVPLFIYMNKFYIETKLNRDLKDDLIKLFTDHVAEKHIYSLMPLLLEAQSTPFQITPSTMASIVKGLYTLRPGKCPSLTLAEAKLRPGERGPWGAA